MTPCAECGHCRIHSRYCSHFEAAEEPEGTDEPEEWPPPETPEEVLLHFEMWVEAWTGECFDCPAEMHKLSLFAVVHEPGCMVAFLHAKLAGEAEASRRVA